MNMKKAVVAVAIVTTLTMSGCATVPMASQEESDKAKTFEVSADKAGLYIFRDSFVGQALKKTVWFDGEALGETAPSTFFYTSNVPASQEFRRCNELIMNKGRRTLFVINSLLVLAA